MIKTERLTKRYGTLSAVNEVSFEVHAGEVLGFLGPNGAGKTTTMRMIAGFIAPTSGTVTVCGHDVQSDPLGAKRSIGYLPEGAPLYGEMSVRGFLEFIAELRGLSGSARARRLEFVIARLQLSSVLAQSIETLSKGYRRRVGLAQALLQDPPVLILDEPTDGLDPNQKHEVRTLINEMAPGKIIIISTHLLEEVEAVCTRAIIIARGRIVADDTPQLLAARSRYFNAVSVQLEDLQQLAIAREAIAALPDVESVEMVEREGRLTALPHAGKQILPALSELAARRGLHLKELHLESGRLDEVFRSITA
jgi:ABC-2 type transport system ATP-binding protein